MRTGARIDLRWSTRCPWEELDLSDWFVFAVGDGRPLRGEGAGGALRFPVTAAVGGRVFEQLSLDVNILDPADARPIELVVVQRKPLRVRR
jgi:hypothetical protein